MLDVLGNLDDLLGLLLAVDQQFSSFDVQIIADTSDAVGSGENPVLVEDAAPTPMAHAKYRLHLQGDLVWKFTLDGANSSHDSTVTEVTEPYSSLP